MNINALSTAEGEGNIITSSTKNYDVVILDSLSVSSETFSFIIDSNCSQYENIRFMFLNSLGQFDYYNADLLSKKSISTKRETYMKTLPENYTIGDRGTTITSLDSQDKYTVTTNWMSEEYSDWLTTEFFNSKEVYVIDENYNQIPVVLDNNEIECKKDISDRLINYTFNYTPSFKINTARG